MKTYRVETVLVLQDDFEEIVDTKYITGDLHDYCVECLLEEGILDEDDDHDNISEYFDGTTLDIKNSDPYRRLKFTEIKS
jgi:hypothetical protein